MKFTTLKLSIINATTNALYNLHSGDYLAPFVDRVAIDTDIAGVEHRLLQESENRRDIVALENDAIPPLNLLNYRRLLVDNRSPRAWVGQRYPYATAPATASSAFTLVTGRWRGAWSVNPPNPVADDVYYNRVQHHYKKYLAGVYVQVGFAELAALYTGTSHWLGERTSANDAAAHVPLPLVAADNYFFYHSGEGRVEQLTNATYTAPVGLNPQYVPHALVLADDIRKELLADETLYTDKTVTGMHISPTDWQSDAKIDFTRALTAADDDRIIACHLRWEERNPLAPSSTTAGLHRSFAGQIDGLTFRTLGERTSANESMATECGDWFVRRPSWNGNFKEFAEMRISYGRQRLADGRDAIRFLLAAGDVQTSWADRTRIFNFQGRFVLHH